MALVTKEFKLDLAPGKLRPVVNASQGDIGRPFMARCYWDGSPWTATGYTANIRGRKPDGTVFDYTTTVDGSTVTFETTEQMTIISGPVECELVFSNDGDVIASANFVLMVEESPYDPDALSESVITGIVDLIEDTIGGDVRDEVQAELEAHPEWTTTVQDGAVTYAKLDDSLKWCVTPEMFGAVGDGTTDDTAAVQAAINTGIPVILLSKYKATSNINVPAYSNIFGKNISTTGIVFGNSSGFVIKSRWVKFECFTIDGDGTGDGISFNGTDAHYCILNYLIINRFSNGINFNAAAWNCVCNDIRLNYCTVGITNGSNNAFCMSFNNVYTNQCPKCVELYGFRATFNNCNFGIIAAPAIDLKTNARVTFNECNFECDSKVITEGTSEHLIFKLAGYSVVFDGCKFVNIKSDNATFLFGSFSSMMLIDFRNCKYESDTAQDEMTQVFSKNSSSAACYGAIRFSGGCQSIPRPDYYSAQIPNWVDVENSKPIVFYASSNIDKTKLQRGAILFIQTGNIVCVYDGTNVKSLIDGSTVV